MSAQQPQSQNPFHSQPNTPQQQYPPPNTSSLQLNRQKSFRTGFNIGIIVGGIFFTAGGYGYLRLSNDTIFVKNGRLVRIENNPVTTTNTENNPNIKGERNASAGYGSIAVGSGDNASISQDRVSSPDGQNSPSVTGNTNVTVIYNSTLPGFSSGDGYIVPPPELSNYPGPRELKRDALMPASSDEENLSFPDRQTEVVIAGKVYTSRFRVLPTAQESKFVFKLDESQKAALLQFGLEDLPSGNTSSISYSVKILSNGELLWAGDSTRGQRPIISVPLEIPGRQTLAIEVTNNSPNPICPEPASSNSFFGSHPPPEPCPENNSTHRVLHFTQAKLFK